MKKRFLQLGMLLITIVLAQASFVANAAGIQGKYTPRTTSEATFSSFMKSIRANQETGLIDPALMRAGLQAAQTTTRDADLEWVSAGPDNFGGLTRGVVYDNDGNVIIGTIGGGIYKSTNEGITFRFIAGIEAPISFMAKDSQGNIYIGTGEGRDAQLLNGLDVLGYETSFVGKGIYKMNAGTTNPQLLDATASWKFVNEITITNNKIYAAVGGDNGGIMMSEDNGTSWTQLIAGNFRSVKSNNNGDVLAADDVNVYLSKAGAAFENVSDGIASNSNPKIIAMSPSDANFMYIAFLASGYKTDNIYFTDNGGNTWGIAMSGTNLYEMFGTNADNEGIMVVYPNNPRKLLVGSDNLWLFEDATAQGVNSYRPRQISESNTDEYTAVAWNRYIYVHQGIQQIAFNPSNANVFFVGTNGGVFKGEYYQSIYSFKGSNRYFVTEDDHCSPARMMSVGVGGTTAVIGGCLDHGTLYMQGSESMNSVTTGEQVFPHVTNNGYASAYFTKSYAGGPCAISTIDPLTMYVSGTGALSTPIYRTQTGGVDYDGNFEGGGDDPVITNSNAFRTPYAYWETYDDNHHSFEVKEILETYNNPLDTLDVVDTLYINSYIYVTNNTIFVQTDTTLNMYTQFTLNDTLYETADDELFIYNVLHDYLFILDVDMDTLELVMRYDAKAGEEAVYYSDQAGYPILYTLPEPPHDPAHVDPNGGYMWIAGDTIRGLHDPLKTNYVVAVENCVYMTRDALIFDKPTDWFKISDINGIPSAVTISKDGTTAFVGTVEGNFYKITNINDAFAAEQADVTNTLNICVEIEADETTFAGRAITSISVNPNNNNEVLVTLGNYGNTDYVFISQNGGASFTAASGLPAMPVYSSVIEKSTGLYIVGTEHGIYTSSNGTSWTKSGVISCPVMDIKQAVMEDRDGITVVLYDEMGNPTYVFYTGIYNEGMIYAATYGAGIIACGDYKEGGDFDVEENELTESNIMLNIYPNPVKGNGNINITLTESANVSYQIYDLSGRMVASNDFGYYGQGDHTLTFSAENLTSGSYIIRLQAGSKSETTKFLVY